MSYRPITDLWILARAKLLDGQTWYGAYPGGFPERARALLGVTINDPVLHVCGGKAKFYPYKGGFGPNDRTLDLDEALKPDYLQDAREPFPLRTTYHELPDETDVRLSPWPAILMDPPYSEQDAEKYAVGASVYPSPNLLLKNALQAVRPGGRVGMIHYILPQPPTPAKVDFETKFIAAVGVLTGFNNRVRIYSVFERLVNE